MEATVTIALSEVESLKKHIIDLKEEANRYKNQKEFNRWYMVAHLSISHNRQSAAKILSRNIWIRFRDYRNHNRLCWKRVEYR